MRRKLLPVSLLLCAIGLAACMSPPVRERQVSAKPSGREVLIASEGSKFKNAVIEIVLAELVDEGHGVVTVDHKKLNTLNTQPFDAIVILNQCWARRLDRSVRRFLDHAPNKEKIILLTTRKDKDWKPDVPGVDAITCASNMAQVETVARSLITRIHARLRARGHPRR